MVPGDDVQLPDLHVIQRYSLAVRGATAPAADVIEVLQADLAWLTGAARRRPAEPAKVAAAAEPAASATSSAKKSVTKKPAPTKRSAAATKAPAKKAAAKKSGARRA